MPLSEAKKRMGIFFVLTSAVLVACFILTAVYSGFVHESKRFRTMVMTMVLALIFQMLLWEPLRFIVLAVDHATWPQEDHGYTAEKGETKPSHITYLKARLRGLRSELLITDNHRNEALNQKYKRIAHDLFLYGSYFLTLLLNILVGEDPYLYYNTNIMTRLFKENTSITMGLSYIEFFDDVHTFLKITMVDGFHADSRVYGYGGWWAMEQWQRMGVVRLRQVRTETKHIGLCSPIWANTTYGPEWRLPYQRLHYTDKFWRIFDPFRPVDVEPSFLDGLLLKFEHQGELLNYPELGGYVSLLMNTQVGTLKQIAYLRKYSWLDRNTWALFIDFTLYNVDANAFTMVTLRVEYTPFGIPLPQVGVECVKMVGSVDQMNLLLMLVVIVFFFLVVQFMRELLTKLWYDPAVIREAWNLVDLVICLLNVLLIALWIIREAVTNNILDRIKSATKAQYLMFQRPMRLHVILTIVKGFLICITTLRLWKVFQFASVFQHFTQTLSSAWQAVASLGAIIVVFLMGIGIALAVPNGNNAMVFRHVIQAIITCLWYSVGFNGGVTPKEFFYGGVVLGVLLYLLLVFLVAIILMNVFASVIYHYFEVTGHDLKEQRQGHHLSFLQFLRAEYGDVLRRCPGICSCLQSGYQRRKRTVAQNVALKLDQKEQKTRKDKPKKLLTDEQQHADYLRRIRRSFGLMAVLQVQMDLLERLILGDDVGNVPTPLPSDSDSENFPEMYQEDVRPPSRRSSQKKR